MRNDFCAFILTHGRPDRVHTYETLQRGGYTGPVYIVIDDEDDTEAEYRRRYGERVLQFSKSDEEGQTETGDNSGHRSCIIFARNACWRFARDLGYRYFIQLDDDYNSGFYIRFDSRLRYGNTHRLAESLDEVFEALVEFMQESGALTVALSQGGDHIGGKAGTPGPRLTRKAMNSFVCSVDRPFRFVGRINEDVNTYTSYGRRGELFLTVMQAQVNQLATQSNSGGMANHYVDAGTYLKSFYSVLYCPSSVKVGVLGDPRSPHYRIHHKINWHHTAPKILREDCRNARL